MNFDDTPSEAAYRAEVRAWIADNAPPVPATRRRRDSTPEWVALATEWQQRKADAGYVGIAWPDHWHGGGGTVGEALIFAQEEIAARMNFSYFDIGLNLCVPTIGQFADQATIDRLVPPTKRGEVLWCQLFSEPGAGSDLAGIGTRAVRDGDDWVIDGQKVWNSWAQLADYGLLITRTDPHVPKHRGLTMFWVDMKSPGIEVRPIQQMSGVANFNEVFLSGVRIPDSQRLGEVGGGWRAALATLMNERVSVSDVGAPLVADAIRVAQATPGRHGTAADDPALRHRLVDHYLRSEGVDLTRSRLLTAISRGEAPGPENAIMKLVAAQEMQDLAHDVLSLRGPAGLTLERSDDTVEGIFADSWLWSPGWRLGGGADEILRTVIAERVLGLPADARPDKDAPFRPVSK